MSPASRERSHAPSPLPSRAWHLLFAGFFKISFWPGRWAICVVISAWLFWLSYSEFDLEERPQHRKPQPEIFFGRAGHLRYFLSFSILKNDFLHFLTS